MAKTGRRYPSHERLGVAALATVVGCGLMIVGVVALVLHRPVHVWLPPLLVGLAASVLVARLAVVAGRGMFPSLTSGSPQDWVVEYPLDPVRYRHTLRRSVGVRVLPFLFIANGLLQLVGVALRLPTSTTSGVDLGIAAASVLLVAAGLVYLQMPRIAAWELARKPPERRPRVHVRLTPTEIDWQMTDFRGPWGGFGFHTHWTECVVRETTDAYYLVPTRRRLFRPVLGIPKDLIPAGLDLGRLARRGGRRRTHAAFVVAHPPGQPLRPACSCFREANSHGAPSDPDASPLREREHGLEPHPEREGRRVPQEV